MNRFLVFIVCSLFFFASSCDEEAPDELPLVPCDKFLIVNENAFLTLDSDPFTVTNAFVIDDCLQVVITASGCDGNAWEVELIGSDSVEVSTTIQRDLRLKLKNEEDCDAVINKPFAFELRTLGVKGSITLNLDGWDKPLNYSTE
ncbi:hypothetical protein FNH22_12440 [Fulvivirga sp. M361]|uniref:hypothetical protein n=1 Tax=Fulvivirga sp. M361 TaxID=2594266 RepID=UPI00117AC0C6|nr:hypothetical protein [Fulvivirga sp. M361]TRX58681.1 hypothetical protein FNH22_12440 [Fulvivirga sp. M361]